MYIYITGNALVMNNCNCYFYVIFPTHFFSATTTTTTNDVDALASRIEVLVASIKRRSQRLYKDTDGNKGRARIRRKIREEKGIHISHREIQQNGSKH